MAAGLHVSISAEPVAELAGFAITNSIFTSLIVSFLLITFAIIFRSKLKKTDQPSSLQNFVEMIIEALHNFVHSITENNERTQRFFPIIASFFIFIIFNNYVGLLPGVGSIMVPLAGEKAQVGAVELGEEESQQLAFTEENTETITESEQFLDEGQILSDGQEIIVKEEVLINEEIEEVVESTPALTPLFRAGTADLNTTLALAIISVVLTQIYGFSYLGFAYFKKYLDFSNAINFFVGILEFILEIAKVLSFAFRLFGNIFAGEILLVVMTYLVKVVVPAPFYALELFVGFIQALVFAMLSLLFFNLAAKGHEE